MNMRNVMNSDSRSPSLPVILMMTMVIGSWMALPAHSETQHGMTDIPSGATRTIDQHGTCREVTNNTSLAVMVPHGTAEEWSTGANAFLANVPLDMEVQSCSGDCTTFSPGAIQPDGSIYMGNHEDGRCIFAKGITGAYRWSTNNIWIPGVSSFDNGFLNTSVTPFLSSYPAATACRNLGGAWYLPAMGEFLMVQENWSAAVAAGLAYNPDLTLWTSTQTGIASAYAVTIREDGEIVGTSTCSHPTPEGQLGWSGPGICSAGKASTLRVICFRGDDSVVGPLGIDGIEPFLNEDLESFVVSEPIPVTGPQNYNPVPFSVRLGTGPALPEPERESCETGPIGSVCSDGAIYAGDNYDGSRFFIAPEDEPSRLQFATTNFTPSYSQTVDEMENDGFLNSSLIHPENPGRVFPATDACQARGPLWYLPSILEMRKVFDNISLLDHANFPGDSPSYWTSSIRTRNQIVSGSSFALRIDGFQFSQSVTTSMLTRCMRRSEPPNRDAVVSVNGGPWVKSGNLSIGDTFRVGMTTSPEFATRLYATLEAGDEVFTFYSETLDPLPVGDDPCSTGPIGSVCFDGAIYAGDTVNGFRMYVWPESRRNWSWKTVGTATQDTDSPVSGRRNTDAMMSLPDLHRAASRCRALGPDWYMPAQEEVRTIASNLDAIVEAGFVIPSTQRFWTSTEANATQALTLLLSQDNENFTNSGKQSTWSVLCVRNDILEYPDPGTPDAFELSSVEMAPRDRDVTSNQVVLSGLSNAVPIPFSVTGDPGAAISINGGDYVTEGILKVEDRIVARVRSAADPEVTTSMTLEFMGEFHEFSVTSSPDCRDEDAPAGSYCDDGTFLAGVNAGGRRIFIAPSNESGTHAWQEEPSLTGVNHMDGFLNTAALLDLDGSAPAAEACHARGPEWYLPSISEMDVIAENAGALRFAGLVAGDHWSSTEASETTAARRRYTTGVTGNTAKTTALRVRCVRLDMEGDPGTPDALSESFALGLAGAEFTSAPMRIGGLQTLEPVSISVTGDGNPAVSVDGGAFVSSGSVSLGQAVRLRMTASETIGESRFATITIGGVDNVFELRASSSCPFVELGETCEDGAIFAGLTADGARMYVAQEGEGARQWKTEATFAPGTSSMEDGFSNTAAMLAGEGTYPAAEACRARGPEWYLPALSELATIYANSAALPVSFATSAHWSSSEATATNARRRLLTGTSSGTTAKTSSLQVHCIRTDFDLNPGTPDPFKFDWSEEKAARNSTVTSDPAVLTGLRTLDPVAISVSGEGDPSISIDGGPFVQSGTITLGQSVRVRLTSAAGFDETRTAVVNVLGIASSFSVTTFLDCTTGPVGTVCEADGAIHAGSTANGDRIYVAPEDEPATLQWKTLSTQTTGATSLTDGFSNTAVMLAGEGTHPAAAACRARGPEWYLPSFEELTTLHDNRVDLVQAGFGTTAYWSSSEATATNARRRLLTGTTSGTTAKTSALSVRCIRTELDADPGTPDITVFAWDDRPVPRVSLVTSGVGFLTGLRSLAPVPVSVSGDGDPRISINGGPFVSSGTISAGETLVVRLTSAAGFNETHTATVNVAGVESSFSVTTTQDCTTGNVGSICDDGAIFAGTTVNGARMYVAPSDQPGSLRWKTVNTTTPGAGFTGDGFANTAAIMLDASSHPAAAACRARGNEWYLPAFGELTTLYNNRNALTHADFTTATYWSSTETDSATARRRLLSGTTNGSTSKVTRLSVRCVRTDLQADPGTPDSLLFPEGSLVARDQVVMSGPAFLSGVRNNDFFPVSVAGQGDPEISIAGGPFVTTGQVRIGEPVVIRMRSPSEFDQTHVATVTVGGVSTQYSLTTLGDCTLGPIGAVCEDGAIHAGTSLGLRLYVAPEGEDGTLRWKTSRTSTPGTLSTSDGRSNTDAIFAAGIEDHPAAAACVARGPDWFLPAYDQLTLLYVNRAALSGAGFVTGAHWSSTESAATTARRRLLTGTTNGTTAKDSALNVRCVRN